MNRIKKIFDPPELQIYRFKQGIKLINPEKKNLTLIQSSPLSLADIFKLPLSIYFLDCESKLQNCNIELLKASKVNSLRDVYEKSVFDIYKNTDCLEVIRNDQKVISGQKKLFFDEQLSIQNELPLDAISIKLPWYNEANEIIGVAGFSAIIGQYSLAKSLSLITNLGILDQGNKLPTYTPGLQLGSIYLTKRETEVFHYMFRGKSSRLIAEALAISERTVHTHIENIKNKMGVSNKAELIEKALEFIQFIPK